MAVIPFEDSDFIWGQAGLAGTGITAGEKLSLGADIASLRSLPYIMKTASTTTSAEQALDTLATGLLKVTTGTGNLSTAVAADLPVHTHSAPGSVQVVIDGGGSTITTGIKMDVYIPFGLTWTGWTAMANQSGAIQVDLWRDSYFNFPPVDGDSITGSAPIAILATNNKAFGNASTMTGWSLAMLGGDVLRFNVDSATSIQRVTISLTYSRTI